MNTESQIIETTAQVKHASKILLMKAFRDDLL